MVEASRFEIAFFSVMTESESLRWCIEGHVSFPLIFLIIFQTFFLEVLGVSEEQKFLQDWRLAVLYVSLDLARSCW